MTAATALDEGNGPDGEEGERARQRATRPYVESPIIMATVRVVAPFVFTLGAFVMFHGADSAGGGFQGGVIVGTVILMVAIAFGVDPTRDWLSASLLTVLVVFGVALFMGIGLAAVVFGGAFLEYTAIPVSHSSKYGIELVEVGIGIIVSGAVVGLFFALASGHSDEDEEEVEE